MVIFHCYVSSPEGIYYDLGLSENLGGTREPSKNYWSIITFPIRLQFCGCPMVPRTHISCTKISMLGPTWAWYGMIWMAHDPLCIDRSQARCCEPTVASYLAPSIVLEHGPCLLLPTMMSGLCLTHLEAIRLLLGGKTGRWLRMHLSILLNVGMESHGPTAHTGSQIEWYWRHKLYKHLCIVGPGLPCAYCRFDAVAVIWSFSILFMGLKNHMWLGWKVPDHHTWSMILPLRGPYGDVCFQAPADIVVVADGTLEMRGTRVMRISQRCCATMAIHGHPWPLSETPWPFSCGKGFGCKTKNGSRASNRGIRSRDEGVAVLVNHPMSIVVQPSSGSKKFRADDNSTQGHAGGYQKNAVWCRMHVTITFVSTVFQHVRLAVGIPGMLPWKTGTWQAGYRSSKYFGEKGGSGAAQGDVMWCDEATASQMIHLEAKDAKVNANATTDIIRFVPVFLSYEIGFWWFLFNSAGESRTWERGRTWLIQEKTWIAWVSDLHAVGLMVVDSLILANLHWSSVNFREFLHYHRNPRSSVRGNLECARRCEGSVDLSKITAAVGYSLLDFSWLFKVANDQRHGFKHLFPLTIRQQHDLERTNMSCANFVTGIGSGTPTLESLGHSQQLFHQQSDSI